MPDVELTGLAIRAVRELAGKEIPPLEARFSYSEPGTLHRAFRRRNVLSPHEFRRKAS
jgi:hypothetical protein